MSKSLFFVFIYLFVLSCQTDDNVPEPPDPVLPITDISVAAIRNFLPNELFDGNTIVYRNEEGEEKALVPVVSESTMTLKIEEIEYELNKFKIDFIDSTNLSFLLTLDASGNWGDRKTKLIYLSVFLMPLNINGYTIDNILFENMAADTSQFSNYNGSVEYFNTTFHEVYVFEGKDNSQELYDSYAQVDVNSANGIVAFKDHENALWIFDRFE